MAGETCGVCGREKMPPCPHLSIEAGSMRCLDCGHILRGGEPTFPRMKVPDNPCNEDLACYRLGYERSQAALAAARRECALKDAALDRCHDLFSDIRGDWTDPRSQCREGMAVCRKALAAPAAAAGEEGTR